MVERACGEPCPKQAGAVCFLGERPPSMGFPALAEHKADADATHSHFLGKGLHYWGGEPDVYTMLQPEESDERGRVV